VLAAVEAAEGVADTLGHGLAVAFGGVAEAAGAAAEAGRAAQLVDERLAPAVQRGRAAVVVTVAGLVDLLVELGELVRCRPRSARRRNQA
jgi:hypothetical protein